MAENKQSNDVLAGALPSTATATTAIQDLADGLGTGEIEIDGDIGVLVELFGLLDEPDFHFDIVTP